MKFWILSQSPIKVLRNIVSSRHVFSAFVIAMTLYYISSSSGSHSLIVAGIILAIVRGTGGGVHFSRDVVVGAIVGSVFGMMGFRL